MESRAEIGTSVENVVTDFTDFIERLVEDVEPNEAGYQTWKYAVTESNQLMPGNKVTGIEAVKASFQEQHDPVYFLGLEIGDNVIGSYRPKDESNLMFYPRNHITYVMEQSQAAAILEELWRLISTGALQPLPDQER